MESFKQVDVAVIDHPVINHWIVNVTTTLYLYTQPFHHGQDVTHGCFFKLSAASLNSKFLFFVGYSTKAKDPRLPNN